MSEEKPKKNQTLIGVVAVILLLAAAGIVYVKKNPQGGDKLMHHVELQPPTISEFTSEVLWAQAPGLMVATPEDKIIATAAGVPGVKDSTDPKVIFAAIASAAKEGGDATSYPKTVYRCIERWAFNKAVAFKMVNKGAPGHISQIGLDQVFLKAAYSEITKADPAFKPEDKLRDRVFEIAKALK